MKVTLGEEEEPEPFVDDRLDGVIWYGMEPIVIGKRTQKFPDPRNSRVNWKDKDIGGLLFKLRRLMKLKMVRI